MTQKPLIFCNAGVPASALRNLQSEKVNSHNHWAQRYPALAILEQMDVQSCTVMLPHHCLNTALNAYLLDQLGLPIDSGMALPQAINQKITLINQSLHSYFYRLSLVHWHAGRDKIHLVPLTSKMVTSLESLQILETVKPWLTEMGWTIYESSPLEYFIQTKEPFEYISPSLEIASSEQLEYFLPQGQNLKNWQTLLTEIQMIFFKHPVNQAREASGELTINSVWLDGMSYSNVWTDENLTLWANLLTQIHHCQHSNIDQHLQELDALISPIVMQQENNQPINITVIGDTWHKTMSFTQPRLLKRLKNKLTLQDKIVLQWLKIPV